MSFEINFKSRDYGFFKEASTLPVDIIIVGEISMN